MIFFSTYILSSNIYMYTHVAAEVEARRQAAPGTNYFNYSDASDKKVANSMAENFLTPPAW